MHQVREYRTKALGGRLGIAKEPAGNFWENIHHWKQPRHYLLAKLTSRLTKLFSCGALGFQGRVPGQSQGGAEEGRRCDRSTFMNNYSEKVQQ